MNLASQKDRHCLRDLLGVGLFTGAYMLVAITAALNAGNGDFIIYLIAMALLITAIMAVHTRVRLSRGLLWALATWGACTWRAVRGRHLRPFPGPMSPSSMPFSVCIQLRIWRMHPTPHRIHDGKYM